MKNWYQMSQAQVMKTKETSGEGISGAEAAKRLKQYGPNILEEGKKKSILQVFGEQFLDLLVIILIIAAVISALSGNPESTAVIIVVLILNAILGTVQYSKARKSLESLKNLSSPSAKVYRDHVRIEIDSRDIVPGDILSLEAGDMVAADGRILHNYSLQVNESALTGESTNVDKSDIILKEDLTLGDRINMVYSGSLVTYGRALVVVTETGMDTEMGKIARLMNDSGEKKTPLQVSLDQFSRKLATGIMIICVLVFGLSIIRGTGLLDSLLFAVALAVAAIPEALGSIVTIVQAMGTQKMAKENAIIKDLKAVETLGCVSVICSDKTGTLTQNKMTVRKIYAGGRPITPAELTLQEPVQKYLLLNAILNNDSDLAEGQCIGDPTETALLNMLSDSGLDYIPIREKYPRIEELSFDSTRKLMSSRYQIDQKDIIFTKGALDVMLERITEIQTADGVRPFMEADREQIQKQNQQFSENGLRVLAFAYREAGRQEHLTTESEKDFIFLGLISMMDPPREESVKAVRDAIRAGIKPIMITGDHSVTATAIAKQIGIYRKGDQTVTGLELDQMSDQELDAQIEHISVYARVSPENKIRIVEAWQKKGQIVSMTGDGVNDAPALKKADIGVAMGITGTEVSKDAASMILGDDNFATIIKAVANGRNVYRNIKNAIGFLLSGNMAGILVVLYTSLRGLEIPFQPVHLLFINLLTDSLPALAIGMEPPEDDLLAVKPRDPKEGILTKGFCLQILVQGFLIGLFTIFAYHVGFTINHATAMTMAFSTLSLARLFHGFNCRSKHSIFELGFRRNWYSLGAFCIGVLLLGTVLVIPALHGIFEVAPMFSTLYGLMFSMAVIPTILIQIYKRIKER
ncbi:cation-translocating P-type ATPase [Jutongia huaianensis]|uniref:Cation-translocating P-type ATPase n=1 Tax=Jutongia huaianensis TaxID=2763668 RepID=A0ABR7MZZ1_9FIRM|nr:cation-translocating P-type ATPase [Jutongia huaianensis]MBC8561925.1 cation-translocating P-type ATPase [Jutongia huaianensis]